MVQAPPPRLPVSGTAAFRAESRPSQNSRGAESEALNIADSAFLSRNDRKDADSSWRRQEWLVRFGKAGSLSAMTTTAWNAAKCFQSLGSLTSMCLNAGLIWGWVCWNG